MDFSLIEKKLLIAQNVTVKFQNLVVQNVRKLGGFGLDVFMVRCVLCCDEERGVAVVADVVMFVLLFPGCCVRGATERAAARVCSVSRPQRARLFAVCASSVRPPSLPP